MSRRLPPRWRRQRHDPTYDETWMPMITLDDLFPEPMLDAAIVARHVTRRPHRVLPLAILNYTNMCMFAKAWTPVTRQCRGLVYDTRTKEVVARPWAKFYNYGEHAEGAGHGRQALDLDASVEVTDKHDGSLGILVTGYGPGIIATRGSFESEQALHATEVYHAQYEERWVPHPDLTYLFEIVYPENRIVLDYGPIDDLILLGAVERDTGRAFGPHDPDIGNWPGPRNDVFAAPTLREALEIPPRANAEGVVVRFVDTVPPVMVKVKQEDYVALHRIITNSSARTLWEYLAVDACKGFIDPKHPKHWASYVGLDPERALEILAAGDGWRERLLEGVPDEFYEWVRETLANLQAQVDDVLADARTQFEALQSVTDPAAAFQRVQGSELQVPLMRSWRGGRIDDSGFITTAWKVSQPSGLDRPFARSEDVA